MQYAQIRLHIQCPNLAGVGYENMARFCPGGRGGTEYNQANGYASQHHLVPIPSQENWQRCGRKSIRHKMGGWWMWGHRQSWWDGPFSGLPRWASTRKVKPIWILLKQETVSGSGNSWDICKSAPCSRQITTPAPHHSVFLQFFSCRPTNSVKALKAEVT